MCCLLPWCLKRLMDCSSISDIQRARYFQRGMIRFTSSFSHAAAAVLPYGEQCSSAFDRSAIRSSGCSSPTETRINPSDTSAAVRASTGALECVVARRAPSKEQNGRPKAAVVHIHAFTWFLRGSIAWTWLKLARDHTPARNVFAAATMFLSAGITSSHARVFKPQSGLTHSRSAGIRSAALRINCTMCSWLGIFGE
jgi:hypothetical protein